jgi:hypothetical protein
MGKRSQETGLRQRFSETKERCFGKRKESTRTIWTVPGIPQFQQAQLKVNLESFHMYNRPVNRAHQHSPFDASDRQLAQDTESVHAHTDCYTGPFFQIGPEFQTSFQCRQGELGTERGAASAQMFYSEQLLQRRQKWGVPEDFWTFIAPFARETYSAKTRQEHKKRLSLQKQNQRVLPNRRSKGA